MVTSRAWRVSPGILCSCRDEAMGLCGSNPESASELSTVKTLAEVSCMGQISLCVSFMVYIRAIVSKIGHKEPCGA